MRLLRRIANIWRLSELEPGRPQDEYKKPGTQVVTLIKKPENKQEASFIPRKKQSPIEKINSIGNES